MYMYTVILDHPHVTLARLKAQTQINVNPTGYIKLEHMQALEFSLFLWNPLGGSMVTSKLKK